MNALILFGTEGHPEENWFSWLKKELDNLCINTEIPLLPNSNNPKLDDWLSELGNHQIDEDTILIGHSLGSVLILKYLEKNKCNSAFLTAPFYRDLGWDVLKESNFFNEELDWENIKENCKHFEILTSINDPYLKKEDGDYISDNLGVENQLIDINKHFNVEEFSLLLEKIKKL